MSCSAVKYFRAGNLIICKEIRLMENFIDIHFTYTQKNIFY